MSKQHFEFLAKWIGLNTRPGTSERSACILLAATAGAKFNERFDQARFVKAVDAATQGNPSRQLTASERLAPGAVRETEARHTLR